jgi:acetylornithine/succinyldiaminopimelate/putrescine aminotransferase
LGQRNFRKKIDFAKLTYQYNLYKDEIDEAIAKVLNHGKYIMGPEINELEENLCAFTGAKNAVTCGSGTDALAKEADKRCGRCHNRKGREALCRLFGSGEKA